MQLHYAVRNNSRCNTQHDWSQLRRMGHPSEWQIHSL